MRPGDEVVYLPPNHASSQHRRRQHERCVILGADGNKGSNLYYIEFVVDRWRLSFVPGSWLRPVPALVAMAEAVRDQ